MPVQDLSAQNTRLGPGWLKKPIRGNVSTSQGLNITWPKESYMMNSSDMMNQASRWMSSGIVIWTVIGIVVGVLLILVMNRRSKK